MALVPLARIVSWIAAVYAASVLGVSIILNLSGIDSLSLAVRAAAVLNVLLWGVSAAGWRYIWKWFPKLGEWIYPDLNGEWDVEINWHWANKTGTKLATAFIKQSLLKFSIEFISDESESETLVVVPQKDQHSSRPFLFYIYRGVGKAGAVKKQDPHIGTAILKLDQASQSLLHGNYFTDRATSGQFTLRRELTGNV